MTVLHDQTEYADSDSLSAELLIKEARRLRRRRQAIASFVMIVIVIVIAALVTTGALGHSSPKKVVAPTTSHSSVSSPADGPHNPKSEILTIDFSPNLSGSNMTGPAREALTLGTKDVTIERLSGFSSSPQARIVDGVTYEGEKTPRGMHYRSP